MLFVQCYSPAQSACGTDQWCIYKQCQALYIKILPNNIPAMPADGAACDDRNPSTSNDHYTAGVCSGTFNPAACTQNVPVCMEGFVAQDNNSCFIQPIVGGTPCEQGRGVCDGNGGCVITHRDGEPCSTGNLCITGETFTNGVCGGGAPVTCNSGNSCLFDSCNPNLGCNSVPITYGTFCLAGSVCDGNGACIAQP
jgi:hypothetical protein